VICAQMCHSKMYYVRLDVTDERTSLISHHHSMIADTAPPARTAGDVVHWRNRHAGSRNTMGISR
jgi:hypothetical protein